MELKLIAYLCMILDHFAVVFLRSGQTYYILRSFGRLAFPLFVYGIVKGIRSTSCLRRYVLRVFLLGLLSQAPYMALFGVRRLNVCFELCGILLVLSGFKLRGFKQGFFPALGIFLCCYSEYKLRGLFLALSMHALWGKQQRIKYPVWAVFAACLNRGFYRVSALAVLLIRMFEWSGNHRKAPRWFYLIYPVHLAILRVFQYV